MARHLSVTEALRRLLEQFSAVEAERISLANALGRVLAEPFTAEYDLPSFNYSSMDGFAVRTVDVTGADPSRPAVLDVIADIPAGSQALVTVEKGQAARIMTGAPIPPGADAVVRVEDTDVSQQQAGVAAPVKVGIYHPVGAGDHVRQRGQDARQGEHLIAPGVCLRPQELGLLAMLGRPAVNVFRRPRVALLTTGDELVPVGSPLGPGQIHDSNTYTLAAQIEQSGAVPILLGIIPDRPEAVQMALERAVAERVDLILSSAGVSVGAFDFVRSVVAEHGQINFWRVNMRPGKPLVSGTYRGIPLIGLPGNPVSAFVGFEVFVRPVLLRLAGLVNLSRPSLWVELAEAIQSDGRQSYLRAVVQFQEGRWLARLCGHQGSGNLRGLVLANALLIVPSEVKSLPIGARVEVWYLGSEPGQEIVREG